MTTYKDAGVDIAAGSRAVELMKAAIQATYTPAVLAGVGAFGGLYDAASLRTMQAPVLVASTDGVGTKVKVAAQLGQFDTIGADLVNHCANDILVQGARPLFFLDYVAASRLIPEQVTAVVTGIAQACQLLGCVLLGGETAEMPGVYAEGEFDVAGTIVGVVERARIVDGQTVTAGDALIGLPSSGLHTNGYSLARRVLAGLDWSAPCADLPGTRSIGDALLAVHRCYLAEVQQVWAAGITIKAMAHITGGGLVDNVPRSLPAGLGADFDLGTWPVPPIFGMIQRVGQVPDADMFHAFNMGLGMVLVVAGVDVPAALATLAPGAYPVGRVVPHQPGAPRVSIR
jgi:phosphoribosylformylglycinamidine cyclo-ligase